MVHGRLGSGQLYYSGGVFNGNGPGFRNVDNQADAIGRATLAPFAGRGGAWRRLWLGASGWYGRHVAGPVAPVEATPGGVVFFAPRWRNGDPPGAAMELREDGPLTAAGGELNLPLGPRFGLRGEFVWKRQRLLEADTTLGATPAPVWATRRWRGSPASASCGSGCWATKSCCRSRGSSSRAPRAPTPRLDDGLMLAVRGEILKQNLATDLAALGDPNRATTRVVAATAGLNYWHGLFVRVSINYVLNAWSGNSEVSHALRNSGGYQHEILVRAALSL